MELSANPAPRSSTRSIPLRVRPTNLRKLLSSSMVVMHAQAAGARVSLNVSVDKDVPAEVMLDAAKVGWAVVNLVGNALRYVRPGSRHTHSGVVKVRVSYDAAAPAVMIEVQDNGPGILPGIVRRLLSHEDPQGPSGLGLLLVDDIVVAHGGSVTVRSSIGTEDHGTTIRLTIPIG